jgi:hypothetical protein
MLAVVVGTERLRLKPSSVGPFFFCLLFYEVFLLFFLRGKLDAIYVVALHMSDLSLTDRLACVSDMFCGPE